MAGKSKKFRVATEGATTDGRIIERSWIEQMAKNYDPKKYGARVNMEHIKGYAPDGTFKRYGDVLALSYAENSEGKLELFAVIDPTDELVTITTKNRQKIYTSIEVNPKFADTGEAYLVGLAITDDPASLGTEMLQFSAKAEKNPLASRKFHPENLFTEAIEFTLELEADSTGLIEGFAAKVRGMVGAFKKSSDTNFTELQDAITVIAESQQALLEKYNQLSSDLTEAKACKTELDKLSAAHNELVQKLSKEPEGQRRDRTPGGNATTALTDC